jgi:large repetitive protein
MTDQRELDRVLGAFLADGIDELADRVIEAALDQVDHTSQRHPMRLPRRLQNMPVLTRVAAAAAIGVLAVGGAVYLLKPGQQGMTGGPGTTATPTPVETPAPSTAATPAPTPTAAPTPPILTGPLGVGRQIHTATALADGRVLVAGGFDARDDALASAAIYDATTNTFSPTGSMAAARGLATATLLADGRVLVAGGGSATWVDGKTVQLPASAELFDPTAGTFSSTGHLATPREGHTATRLRDGRVLIAGGVDVSGSGLISAELYDPRTGTFSPTGSMTTPRSFHTATVLSDGRVLVAGGSPSGWSWTTPLPGAGEIYDPTTGAFSPTGPMVLRRTSHAATQLADGRVLITGGVRNNGTMVAASEIFDPRTGTFTATGAMADMREFHTATLLADGRVLVVGGGGDYANANFLSSAELYDPDAGAFTATGPMADARTYHGASLLADGRVLVTGGYGAKAPLASAEVYDPTTGTFSPAGTGG